MIQGKAKAESKDMPGKRTGGTPKALVNGKNLRANCARSWHDGGFNPTLVYGRGTLVLSNKSGKKKSY